MAEYTIDDDGSMIASSKGRVTLFGYVSGSFSPPDWGKRVTKSACTPREGQTFSFQKGAQTQRCQFQCIPSSFSNKMRRLWRISKKCSNVLMYFYEQELT